MDSILLWFFSRSPRPFLSFQTILSNPNPLSGPNECKDVSRGWSIPTLRMQISIILFYVTRGNHTSQFPHLVAIIVVLAEITGKRWQLWKCLWFIVTLTPNGRCNPVVLSLLPRSAWWKQTNVQRRRASKRLAFSIVYRFPDQLPAHEVTDFNA